MINRMKEVDSEADDHVLLKNSHIIIIKQAIQINFS